MDLDEQKLSDPNPPLQLIKDTLTEMEVKNFRRFEYRSAKQTLVYRSHAILTRGRNLDPHILERVCNDLIKQAPPGPIPSSSEPADRLMKKGSPVQLPSDCGGGASAMTAG